MPAAALATARKLGDHAEDIYAAVQSLPATITHADFRLDNVVFGLEDRPLIYDWQSASRTPGPLDLASLIVLSFEPDRRRALEGPTIARYRSELAAHGAPLEEEDLRRGYGLAIVHFFLLGVSALVTQPERSMFVTWARRMSHALADLDLDSLLR